VDFNRIILILFIVGLLFVYKIYNPIETDIFPKCPFLYLTGYKCPGCGSCASYIQSIKKPNAKQLKIRKFLLGYKASIVILVIVCFYFVLRNIV